MDDDVGPGRSDDDAALKGIAPYRSGLAEQTHAHAPSANRHPRADDAVADD